MSTPSRRNQPSWGPVVISLAAGVLVLLSGALVNGCRISKLLSPSGGAAGRGLIVVVPSAVRDSAIAGAPAMRMTSLAVSNGGTWSATPGESWIHVSPASGGSRGTLQVSLDPKNLNEGLYEGVVTLQEPGSDGASVSVPVSFLIQQPVLAVEPEGFSFSARSSNQLFLDTLEVWNEGTGPLVWTATTENHSSWLVLADTSGTDAGKIALRASNAGLGFFGTFKETIIVDSPGAKNSPKRIQVTLKRRHNGGNNDSGTP